MITQSAVTIIAEILPGHEAALQQLLDDAGRDPANNRLVGFGSFGQVHFARFFILDSITDLDGRVLPPRLVFLADVDGPAEPFLSDLCATRAEGLDQIFAHCSGYYSGKTQLADFMARSFVPTAANYVNTIGRSVQQVHQEAALHDAIEQFLDRSQDEWRGASARRVRAAIQEFVESDPSLAWARQRAQGPDVKYVLSESLDALVVGVAGIVLFPYVLLGLPIFAFLLRMHEQSDVARDVIPDDARIQALAAQEDHGTQNPFTSAGLLKPGPFRRLTASVVLWGTNLPTRHVFNHADLIGVKTIHFARWIFIDQKRRVVFASNYDGSLENYMDDFIDKIAWGLNITFSNGVDYPRTNWLIFDGADDEQVFKRFNLMHQLVCPFWYAAYQGLTALNIENNARIRAGLYGEMDEPTAQAWLHRF